MANNFFNGVFENSTYALLFVLPVLFFAVSILIKSIFLRRLRRLIKKTPFIWDSALIKSLGAPLTITLLALSILIFKQLALVLKLDISSYSALLNGVFKLLLIASVVLFADRFLSNTINDYRSKSPALRSSSGILKGIVRGVVVGLGLLIILSTLGISITPILASLGIGSLAVALALQPTLENFFSGVQLVVDKPIRVGDFVELETGEQGFVERIGWRSTWVKMLPNNVVIMPNSVLAQSKIINYFYPEKELSVPVDVSVHYDSDLDFVEKVTVEVAREILKTHKWGVPEYDTFVVFHTFDSSSINFTVMLRTREYFNRFFIKSEFMKALHKRYKKEGIVIPYPIRAINVEQESVILKNENQ